MQLNYPWDYATLTMGDIGQLYNPVLGKLGQMNTLVEGRQ